MEFVLQTPASNPGIKPTFEYSISGTNQFTAFTPIDGTNGFKNTGVVAWDAADLTGHVADDVTGAFDIRITRTHAVAGSVSLFYAKTAATVVYSWDKNGDVSINTLVVATTISHESDPDTQISFTDDQIELLSGSLSMLKLTETTQDLITLGPGSGDVDIDFNGDMFLRGSAGFFGIGTVNPTSALHVFDTVVNLLGRFEATGASSFAGVQGIADDNTKTCNLQMYGGEFSGTQFGSARADTGSIFSDQCILTFGTKSAFDLIIGTANSERMRITSGGDVGIGTAGPGAKLDVNGSVITASNVFINETINTKMGVGLTINQGALDSEIAAFKSSDVAHGVTGEAETDTFGLIKKAQSTSGGLKIQGLKDADGSNSLALQLVGTLGEAVQTAKTTAAAGIVTIDSQIKSGTGVAVAAADGNLVVMRNLTTTRWILDAEGDIFYGGSDDGTITDEYDDAQLLSGFRAMMSPKDSPAFKRFKGWLGDAEEVLVQQGVLTARLAEGGLVSDTALKGLLIDAIMQLSDKVESLERKLNHGAE